MLHLPLSPYPLIPVPLPSPTCPLANLSPELISPRQRANVPTRPLASFTRAQRANLLTRPLACIARVPCHLAHTSPKGLYYFLK